MASWIKSLWRGAELAMEYRRATEAAIEAYQAGKAVPAIVQAFASRTENAVDDALVVELVHAADQAIHCAHRAALALGRAASWVETHVPPIIERIEREAAKLDSNVPGYTRKLRAVTEEAGRRSQAVSDVAAATGVLAVRFAARVERLKGAS